MMDRIFPPKYDFYEMLEGQSQTVALGTDALLTWFKKGILSDSEEIEKRENALDEMRHDMETHLMEAFTTPFDRREIYSISHQMGEILDFCVSTHKEMKGFDVGPDDAIISMANSLSKGMKKFSEAMLVLTKDPALSETLIREIRRSEHEIEKTYIDAMTKLLRGGDPFIALRKREIYHHLKDAGRSMGTVAEILHRIVVSIA